MSFETRGMDKLQRKRLCICILQAASRRNVFAGNGVSPEQYLGFANLPFQCRFFANRKGGGSCHILPRYWSMLSVGTDGCRHLSSLRWDSGPYFEADKD